MNQTRSPSASLGSFVSIVLAAGHGKRMRTSLPKVMHPVAGHPMICYPVKASLDAGALAAVVVVGHGREVVIPYLSRTFGSKVHFAIQHEQKGTAHAVLQAIEQMPLDVDFALILCGDTPLIESPTLVNLTGALTRARTHQPASDLALLTCEIPDPTGYGRIIRDHVGRVVQIREQRDLVDDAQRRIREINPGVYLTSMAFLRSSLGAIGNTNTQGEFYLTDMVAMAARSGSVVDVAADWQTMVGVNDLVQLSSVQAIMQQRLRNRLRLRGAMIADDVHVDDGVVVQPDARVERGATLRGHTVIEAGAVVDVGCVVEDSLVKQRAVLAPYCVVRNATVEAGSCVSPFTHVGSKFEPPRL